MSELERFYNWLEEQEYWISREEVNQKFPDIELKETTGITMKEGENGETMIPKRDLKHLATTGETHDN